MHSSASLLSSFISFSLPSWAEEMMKVHADNSPFPHSSRPCPLTPYTEPSSILVSSLYLQTCQHFLALKASQPAIELLTTSHCPSSYSGHNKTVLWMCPILSWLQAFTQTVKPSFPIMNAIHPRTFYNLAKQKGSLLPLFL